MPDQPYIEPEEQQPQAQPAQEFKEFNPLDEPVNEKSYSRPNVTMRPEDMNNPIPEPTFTPPPIQADAPPPPGPPKPPHPPINPAMQDVSKKDKSLAAGYTATAIVDGYEFLHTLANQHLLTFSERKMKKRYANGDIDPRIQLQYDASGQTISVEEYIAEFNRSSGTTLTVSQEFKDEVTPILQRVLEKKGAVLTDEQLLIWVFGKDITVKAIMILGVKAQMREMVSMLKENTEALRASGQLPPTQPMAAAPQQQPQQQAPQPAPEPQYYTPNPAQQQEEHVYTEHEEDIQVPVTAMGVNEFTEQMINPEGYQEAQEIKKKGRPTKDEAAAKRAAKAAKK